MPLYSLGTTPIVGIEGFKAHVNLKFFKGADLEDAGSVKVENQGNTTYSVPFAEAGPAVLYLKRDGS